jgi:hypothetical protein
LTKIASILPLNSGFPNGNSLWYIFHPKEDRKNNKNCLHLFQSGSHCQLPGCAAIFDFASPFRSLVGLLRLSESRFRIAFRGEAKTYIASCRIRQTFPVGRRITEGEMMLLLFRTALDCYYSRQLQFQYSTGEWADEQKTCLASRFLESICLAPPIARGLKGLNYEGSLNPKGVPATSGASLNCIMLITCQLRRLVLAHLNYGASIIDAYAYNMHCTVLLHSDFGQLSGAACHVQSIYDVLKHSTVKHFKCSHETN